MDHSGNYYEWDVKYRNKSYRNAGNLRQDQYDMITTYNQLGYFDREVYPGHMIFNFRLTKEFGKNFEISFMANNLFNTRKIYRSTITGGYSSLAISQYFGAELKLKL
jgi:outer membrane receptor protein involved in Fe transport